MSEVYPNYHDHIMHDNPLMEDEHFALVFAHSVGAIVRETLIAMKILKGSL